MGYATHIRNGVEIDPKEDERRKAHVRTLARALREITTDEEYVAAYRAFAGAANITAEPEPPTAQEAPMTEEKKDGAIKSGLARSVKGAKIGLAMYGVDRVGKGAMLIAKQPFPQGSKTREFLESDEGRHFVLGILAVLANVAAENEKVPLDPDNIEWVTEATIANSFLFGAQKAEEVSMDSIMGVGMQLWEFAQGLRNPQSMQDIIDMTQKALELEKVGAAAVSASKAADEDAEVELAAEVQVEVPAEA